MIFFCFVASFKMGCSAAPLSRGVAVQQRLIGWCGTHEQTHLCTREHTDAHAHTRTHEYTRVRTRVVSVKAVATAGSVAEHGEEGLPRRGNTIHTLTHLLRLASVALIAPRQRGDQKSAGGGGCFPFQKFKNGGWSSIQTSRAANHCITQRASANRVGTRVCKPGSNPRLHAASHLPHFPRRDQG